MNLKIIQDFYIISYIVFKKLSLKFLKLKMGGVGVKNLHIPAPPAFQLQFQTSRTHTRPFHEQVGAPVHSDTRPTRTTSCPRHRLSALSCSWAFVCAVPCV